MNMSCSRICWIFVFAFSSLTQAQEWTRFRGPNGTGIGQAANIPSEFNAGDFNFKTPLPGSSGCSSPVVWNDKVFVMSADANSATRFVNCIHATTGKMLWSKAFDSKTHHLHSRSSYASCTPTVNATHVFVAWSTPTETILKALDHQGEEAWTRDLGRWESQHGFGTSPIVYKDTLILHNSQQADKLNDGQEPGESFMMAFDAATGKTRWQTELKSTNVCYSVPFVFQGDDGNDELICCSTGDGMFSIDPTNGKRLWSVNDGLFKMRTVG